MKWNKIQLLSIVWVAVFWLPNIVLAETANIQALPSQIDSAEELVELRIKEFDLKRELNVVTADLPIAERRWSESKQKLDALPEYNGVLYEKTEALWSRRLYLEAKRLTIEQRLDNLSNLRILINKWHIIRTESVSKRQKEKFKKDTELLLAEFEQDKKLVGVRVAAIDTNRVALETKLKTITNNRTIQHWVGMNMKYLNAQKQSYLWMLADVKDFSRVASWFHSQIDIELKSLTTFQQVNEVMRSVVALWDYEVFRVESHSISVGKIILAIILLTLGITLSKIVSRGFVKFVLVRFGWDAGAMDAVQKLTFYILLVFFALTALRLVQFPLTVLTFAGGAIALGVGFGSQNILNNFISGLIILVERPIKLGDFVQIDTLIGSVEEVGLRSTLVKTPDNIHLVIPNSAFLEKNVTNWTLSDKVIRTNISLGVAYGSDTQKVQQTIAKILAELSEVLKSPDPMILFTDFGDNALIFEVHFWIRVNKIADKKQIESAVRFQLDQAFRDADITIAFPQRDVHLDMRQPLPVKMIPDSQV